MAKEVVLALAGGGVRGIAHLGAVQCLLDSGYRISGIAGTSAGGMFGAVIAAGFTPQDLIEVVVDFMKSPSFKRTTESKSLAGTAGLEAALSPYIADKNIEDFPIPFVATAVDLTTGEEIILDSGNALEAVLATIAIPGVFPSREDTDLILVDGGVLDPVPVAPARSLDPTLPVVAVVLHKKPDNYSILEAPAAIMDNVPVRLVHQLGNTRLGVILRNVLASYEVASDRLTYLALETTRPDVVVEPVVGHYGMLDTVDPLKLVNEGYIAMQAQLEVLSACYSLRNSVVRITKNSIKRGE